MASGRRLRRTWGIDESLQNEPRRVRDWSELPPSWAVVPLGALAEINPRVVALPQSDASPVHFVPMRAVTEEFGGIDVSERRRFGEVKKGYTAFQAGDVLFAKITPCMENGKLALVPALDDGIAFGSTEFHVVRAVANVTPKWLAHFLSQAEFRKFARRHMTGTAGQLRVATPWLLGTRLPVAPAAEQTRIVDKLEELLSDLDAGVVELKAAQKKLAQYRQSLLKAAVEGRLTEAWRAEQSKPDESGPQLLARILRERRARWEAKQLGKFEVQDKTPPKGWKDKYPEPVSTNTTGLPALPQGWVWASLDQLALTVRNGLSQKPGVEPVGYPILRINAVRAMAVNLAEVRFLSITDDEAAEYTLDEGDLLVTRYNGSVDLLGVMGVVRGLQRPTVHPDKLIRIKPVLRSLLADWMEVCAAVGSSRAHVVSRVKTTAGQTGISGDDIKKMPIPLASMTEQTVAIEIVAVALREIASQGDSITLALRQSAAQRKNILQAAFSGRLVPQDPNDEPASVLLERIRAERVATDRTRTGARRARRPAAPA